MDILKENYAYIVIGLLCFFTIYQDFQYFKTVNTESVYLDYIDMEIMQGDFEMGKAEYLPVITDMGNLVKEVEYNEKLQINDVRRDNLEFDISVTNTTNQEQNIFLPILYYSGYRTLDIQSKEALKTSIGDNGRVSVTVPANYDGTFHMEFCEPWYWRGAEIISAMVLLFIIFYIGVIIKI